MPRLNPKLNNRKKVAERLKEQITSNTKKVNFTQALKDAGYKDSTAIHKSSEVVKSREVQEELRRFELQLEEIVQKDIKQLNEEKRRKRLTPRDNVESLVQLSKLRLLITGGNTSNDKMTVSWED
jgi:phage terminase small subunit